MKNSPEKLLNFFHRLEKLKYTLRHSWLSDGRRESVAEHTWRSAFMAMLMCEEIPDVNKSRVIEMLIVHDLGEISEGDIPAFLKDEEKREQVDRVEEKAIDELTREIHPQTRTYIRSLCEEYKKGSTVEAKIAKAIDKMEALLQHNEADISTWIDLEYSYNLTYGQKECRYNDYLKECIKLINNETKAKVQDAKDNKRKWQPHSMNKNS